MEREKIYGVVVTYNRLELLKENLEALRGQSRPLDKIIVIDNCSTDGTDVYLTQFENDGLFEIIRFPDNLGGSAGFSKGIKEAVQSGCDWVWIMDDDTIPRVDALEQLLLHSHIADNTGFLASKVVWKDGSSHLMNLPVIQTFFDNGREKIPFNAFSGQGALLIGSNSFVSVLVSARAVRKVGLPYREFFIWGDDSEFTDRIVRNGFYGMYVDQSVVLHKTAENYTTDLLTAPDQVAWKFFYEFRNAMFLKRQRKKGFLSFYFSMLNRKRKYLRLIGKRNSGQQAFRKAITGGFRAGLRFRPGIEYVD